jgi:hypothetical protein
MYVRNVRDVIERGRLPSQQHSKIELNAARVGQRLWARRKSQVVPISNMCQPKESKKEVVHKPNLKHSIERSAAVDVICFIVPALFHRYTNVWPLYITAILRILSTHVFLAIHYLYVDKDNYHMKISERQLHREKKDYLVGILIHMWAQVVLQLMFPRMFFTEVSYVKPFLPDQITSQSCSGVESLTVP